MQMNVQHLVDDSESADDDNRYESVECSACAGLHFVNLRTGKVLGVRRAERIRNGHHEDLAQPPT